MNHCPASCQLRCPPQAHLGRGGLLILLATIQCLHGLVGEDTAGLPFLARATETFPCHDTVYAAWSSNSTTFDNSVLVHYMGSAPSFIQFADGTYAIFFVNFDLGTTNKRTSVRTSTTNLNGLRSLDAA
jgi:hypothetical protein